MGRKPRVEYYGAVYHIIHRGRDNLEIFNDDEDKIEFMAILGEAKEVLDFKLISYCILDNQYDLLIKVHNFPISKVLQRVHMLYSRYYNKKYNKTGSPFQGRYKENIAHNDNEILSQVKKVHNMPVYFDIVDSMVEYKWSSDVFIRMNLGSLVDIDFILDILCDDRKTAIDMYENLMDNESEANTNDRSKNSLDEILMRICPTFIDFDLIKKGSKKAYLIRYKQDYIMECRRLGLSNHEIGVSLGITERAVRNYQ